MVDGFDGDGEREWVKNTGFGYYWFNLVWNPVLLGYYRVSLSLSEAILVTYWVLG
jgi:hypothetical protein